jgi:hypothetical protein
VTAQARLPSQALERLLRPRSVAIVGASASPGALGASVLANLERMRYAGEIHLINPKRDEIGDHPCLHSIDDLPSGVDAAVLAIPRAGVLDAVRARTPATPVRHTTRAGGRVRNDWSGPPAIPEWLASINLTRSAHPAMSSLPGPAKVSSTGLARATE